MSYLHGAKPESIDNNPQAHRAKVKMRELVFSAIAEQAEPKVFDAFAGTGQMYSEVWRRAALYTGCDKKLQRDSRLMFCADNRRVMRAINLQPFNIIDLDSYGSPWEQCVILAERRKVQPGELIGIVLTDGAGFNYKMNSVPAAISILTGLRTKHVGLGKKVDAMVDRAIGGLARLMHCDVVKRWQADGKTGAAVRYIGLVLRGKG
jgi:hypothetical protein